MSSDRFAPITSVLLARKGEARPWDQVPKTEADNIASIGWRPHAAVVAVTQVPEKDRACSIRLSAHDMERLGILAVKKNSTRQKLLQEAVAEYLAKARDIYGCACLCEPAQACHKECGGQA
jgi:predicted DNA-binding protein